MCVFFQYPDACVRTVHRDRCEIENLKYAKIDGEHIVKKYVYLKGLGLQKDCVIC